MDTKAVILADQSKLDYFDSQSVEIARTITALEAWTIITKQTGPLMRLAFKARDAISSAFGVKRIGGFSEPHPDNVVVGGRFDFFLVEYVERDILVLTARDKHLDVMTCVTTAPGRVSVTASVVTKNLFGRLYMVPVGLAHRKIVGNSLRKLKQTVDGSR